VSPSVADVTFETVACPLCGSPEHLPERELRDRFDTIPGEVYTVVRCSECRLLFVNPRPNAASMSVFYEAEGYDPFLSSGGRRSVFATVYRLARRFTVRSKATRATRGMLRTGRVLDVGCATGEFLVELRRRGWQVSGVEPGPEAAKFARETYGLSVWDGTALDVPPETEPFELVTLWHVLEHVHALREVLERLRNLLTDGGRLVIAVPNPLSSDARAYGTNWVAWEAPRHLYHFEPAVMLDLLERAGFRAERRGALAFDAFYHSLLSERGGPFGLVRAGWRGLLSFTRGLLGGEGSSELYFAYKR